MMTLIFLLTVMTMTQTPEVSPILKAKYSGKEDVVQQILKSGIELNVFEASATGQTERIRALIASDSKLVNAYAPDGFTPLGLAVFFGYKETVEVLLKAGAEVNQQSRERMRVAPLHSAAAARRLDLAELLLARGADVHRRAETGFTPMHEVAATGQIEFAELLLQKGADINVKDDSGKTPLTLALDSKQEKMAAFLRERGAK